MPDLFPEQIQQFKTDLAKLVHERAGLVQEMRETMRGYRETRANLDERIEQLAAAIHEGEK